MEALKLQGKPAPDIFVKCCSLLGLYPRECIVFEDSQAGVEAARKGKFGLVVGINRGNNRLALLEGGANIVIEDGEDFCLWQLNDNFLYYDPRWILQFDSYDPSQQLLRETLTTLGNGKYIFLHFAHLF